MKKKCSKDNFGRFSVEVFRDHRAQVVVQSAEAEMEEEAMEAVAMEQQGAEQLRVGELRRRLHTPWPQ